MKKRSWHLPPAFYVIQLSLVAMTWIIFFGSDAESSEALAVSGLALVPIVIFGEAVYLKARLSGHEIDFHGDTDTGRRIFGTPGAYTFVVAISTLAVVVATFANAYHILSLHSSGCFGSSLSRIDAIYFTLTTLSTVGYGDITPMSGKCRLVTSGQMLVTMLLLTIFVGLLVAVLSQSKRSR